MKTLIKISVVLLGLLASSVPAFSAVKDKADKLGQHPHLRALMQRRAALRGQVAKRLDLTPDQKAQLKSKRAGIKESVKAIRGDSSLSADQKKAKVRETLQAARADRRASLTPEQQAKLEKARERLRKAGKKRG